MQLTTEAIRTVQRFTLSLPADTLPQDTLEAGVNHLSLNSLSARHQSTMAVSTAARPRTSLGLPTNPRPSAVRSSSDANPDPATTLRAVSLQVLGALRDMEARYRLPASEGLTEEVEHTYAPVRLEDLRSEKDQVRAWIEVVDKLLLTTSRKGMEFAGPAKDKGRPVTPVGERDSDDERMVLPIWARSDRFADDPSRTLSVLSVAPG